MRYRSRAVILWLLLPGLAIAQQPPWPGLPVGKLDQIEAATMAKQQIPAMSIAVVNDRKLLWANGYGTADLENNVPAKASTVYRLGSISKSVTAAAIMQLVERGKLDLDGPIQHYCPAFPQKQWPITARQLLNHTSGIRHYHRGEDLNARHYKTLVEGFRIFDPLLFEPGTQYNYSTYGYSVLVRWKALRERNSVITCVTISGARWYGSHGGRRGHRSRA